MAKTEKGETAVVLSEEDKVFLEALKDEQYRAQIIALLKTEEK